MEVFYAVKARSILERAFFAIRPVPRHSLRKYGAGSPALLVSPRKFLSAASSLGRQIVKEESRAASYARRFVKAIRA
jgi:hypothetical protein